MKKNIRATSIVEAMIVLLIVTMAITGAYSMFSQSIKVTDSNGYKIQAISIAREGIEAMTNIRDTNWKVLPGDYINCWNTFNYNINCHGNTSTSTDILAGSYTIYKDPADYRWKLENNTTGDFSRTTYRADFEVGYDSDGFYTQSGSLIYTKLLPAFTREIKIEYLEDGVNNGDEGSNEQKMQVTSLVQWVDQASSNIKKVELVSVLSNWRNSD